MELIEYINKYYGGNQAAFARALGVPKQRVSDWINSEYIVYKNTIYSKRRDIPLSSTT